MRVSELKAELKERQIDFSDCFDKDGLVDKVSPARLGLIKPSPPKAAPAPAPVNPDKPLGAAFGYDYGVETRQGEDMSMDDAFAAAGWTGEEAKSDPSQTDQSRSPGINRNFGDMGQSDFKKPYSGGGKKGKGRYG